MTEQARPFDRFVIFGLMRTGSNLLERLLGQYEGLATHGEVFNPVFIGRAGQTSLFGITVKARIAAPQTLLEAIDRNLPDKVNGLRYFEAHDPAALDVLLDDPRTAKIILTRDPLESFVSLCIAEYSDIWLIGSEKDRIPMAVPISVAQFQRYCAKRAAFMDRIDQSLAKTRQHAFRIDYNDLLDRDKVNALAMALGARAPLAVIHQPIKRQNPAPLAAKIANYAEIFAELGLPAPDKLPLHPTIIPSEDQAQWVWPRHYYLCSNLPLGFAPLLACPKQPIVAWLDQLPSPYQTGLHLHQLADWRSLHGDARVISVVHHPLDRLYDVFMAKIFSTAPDAFLKIRRVLERRFQIYLPDDARNFERAAYTLDDHRTAFQQFLVFVAANLRGETDIRQDGNWQTQSSLVDIFAQILPITQFIHQSTLDDNLPKIETALGLPPHWARLQRYPHARPAYQLADIYDPQTEALARAAYALDYTRFGFDDWQPGQAAFDLSLPVNMA